MKILLINTPRSPHNMILDSAPDEAKKYIHKKLIGPPLGLLTIAAAVEDEHDVVVFDTKGEYDLNPDAPELDILVENLVKKHKPDIVGVTFIASEFYYGIEIFRSAKKNNKEIITIAGGLHTTLSPNDFTDSSVDIIIPGEAVKPFKSIVNAVQNNNSLENIEGIILNKNGKLKKTQNISGRIDPAKEGFIYPNREHLKKWINTYKVGGSPYPSTYLYTSLGCPYQCTFCSIWCQFEGNYYQRDVESIITELKMLDDYPIVRFSDANTIVNVKFINKLFDRINEEGIKKTYIMDVRTDTAVRYPRLIEKLARAGLKVVICGFESFREEELKQYNKSVEADLIHKAIEIFHQNDIMIRGNYVIPYTYDQNDFDALTEYTDQHRVTYAGYTILTPMPGTPYYEQVKKDIIDHDLSKYNFFNCVMKTTLPLEKFYENVGKLWLIKKGTDVI